MNAYKKHYYFKPSRSPTIINLQRTLNKLGWKKSMIPMLAQFTDKNLEFDEEAANTLEYKHLLSALCQQYCPDLIPQTFYINEDNWTMVLEEILRKKQDTPWILKPALLNNGQGIRLFQTTEAIEAHYLSSNRFGGPHVLQTYIQHPHLLKGHKYSIRLFVIISDRQGAFIYPEGYFNVARTSYQPHELNVLNAHITNEHLPGHDNNVIQIPTHKFEFFKAIYPQLTQIAGRISTALQNKYPAVFQNKKKIDQNTRYAIFGFDFLIDAHFRAWLLEANHGPCFPISDDHPLQSYLYDPFWRDFISAFVDRSHEPQEIFTSLFF